MSLINELAIQNFRVIRDLNYSPKQINIITGRNNTGKSALLDAVGINASGYIHWHLDIDNTPINFITFGEKIAEIKSNLNSVIIFSNFTELEQHVPALISEIFQKLLSEIKAILKFETRSGFVKEGQLKEFIDRDFEDEFKNIFKKFYEGITFFSDFGLIIFFFPKKGEGKNQFYSEFEKLIKKSALKYLDKLSQRSSQISFHQLDYPLGTYGEPKHDFSKYTKINVPKEDSYEYSRGAIPDFIKLNVKIPDGGKKPVVKITHHNKIDIENTFEDMSEEAFVIFEDFIKENNLIKDLKRLSRRDVVYKKEDKLVTIPITAHGHGFIVLLNTLRYLLKAREGILLIEEPENHLHPRYIDVFIENLFVYAQKLNIQVFMSTHSYDLIESALKYPQTDTQKELLLISKMTSDGEIIKKFDYTVDQGLETLKELALDLRGI